MNSPAYDIADYLSEISSLALTKGTDVFVGTEPTSPDDCVTVYDTNTGAPGLTTDPDETRVEYPSIQVRVRNNAYDSCWSLADEIKNTLHGLNKLIQNETTYLGMWCASGPFNMGKDGNNRTIFVVNFDIVRQV